MNKLTWGLHFALRYAGLLVILFLTACGGGSDNSGGAAGDQNALPSVSVDASVEVNAASVVSIPSTASDTDGSIESYSWEQVSGDSVSLSGYDSATLSFDAPSVTVQSTLEFRITVVDNDGGSASDTIVVTVLPLNIAPIADAGEDFQVNEGSETTISGSATDTDGSIATYAWTQVSGNGVTLLGADTATLTFEAPTLAVESVLEFRLTATDDDGETASDTVAVTVVPVNTMPVAQAGDDFETNERSETVISGSGSDADGVVASYLWEQIAGDTVVLQAANTATLTFEAPSVEAASTLEFQLTVTDNEGAANSDSVVVTVNPIGYEITLSKISTRCGEVQEVEAEFTFTDATDNEQVFTLQHDGSETTYLLDPQDLTGDTVDIAFQNGDGETKILFDVTEDIAIHVNMGVQIYECDCPIYDITLTNEPEALTYQTSLQVNGISTFYPSESGDDLAWNDIEICEDERDSVYIANNALAKFAKVSVANEAAISVNGLDDMVFTPMDGGTPTSTSGIAPHTIGYGYHVDAEVNELVSKLFLAFSTTAIVGDTLAIPNSADFTNYTSRVRFPVTYPDLTIEAAPTFFNQASAELQIIYEQHSLTIPRTTLLESFSYEIFDLADITVTMGANELTVSGVSDDDFDAALVLDLTDGIYEYYWFPIVDGVVDYSALAGSAMIDGTFWLFLVDYVSVSGYEAALETFYLKRGPEEDIRARSLVFSIN